VTCSTAGKLYRLYADWWGVKFYGVIVMVRVVISQQTIAITGSATILKMG